MENAAELLESLPGLDCGMCGAKTCAQFAIIVVERPQERKRCIHQGSVKAFSRTPQTATAPITSVCAECPSHEIGEEAKWKDSLGRKYDFLLETFPEDPGPRETIIPHNPMLTREMNIKQGDVLMGRPLGMSCGCPITHCGVVRDVDPRTGVIVWFVTGPLANRGKEIKDLGYYSAQAYEGIAKETQKELKIGMRYWYLPHRCMLQWRHSGMIIFMNKTKEGTRIRIEGIMIG
jgi:uncharacterized Fe-S cluster-containing protein